MRVDSRANASAVKEEEPPEASLGARSPATDENRSDESPDWRTQRALLHAAVDMARVALRCAPRLLV
jgi:hypothetical protein